MYRTLVILRHTFRETIAQPIYGLLLAICAGIVIIFGLLPFFTLGEDTIMFKAVGLDVILLFTLLATLFATSKSIYEEIEDRTMLTLMSKPVQRWQVLVGKYLGIVAAALMAVVILGGILMLVTYYRLPGDYQMRALSLDAAERARVWDYRFMNLYGLLPSLLLIWLQVSVLGAIGVALSTRFSLVVNMPAVILLYLAGNLTRFAFPMSDPDSPLHAQSAVVKGVAYLVSLVLPFLQLFDIRSLTVYAPVAITPSFKDNPLAVAPSAIWTLVAASALYAIAYAAFALAAGMWSFQTRELGGAEG